jgi:hypothetical protein
MGDEKVAEKSFMKGGFYALLARDARKLSHSIARRTESDIKGIVINPNVRTPS